MKYLRLMKPMTARFSSIVATFAVALGGSLFAEDFVLVDRAAGVAPAPIVLTKGAPATAREAAKTLAEYVAEISGARPALMEGEPSPLPERAVWIGVQPALKSLFPGMSFEFSHPEETLIAGNGKHLVIAGRDRVVNGTALESGTANAVFAFLENDLGVRWLWPGPLGTDVPKRERVALAPFERRCHPPFRLRLLWPRSPPEWHRAQHLLDGSLSYEAGHAFTAWWERYHEQHPDYFALLPDGSRKPRRDPRDVKLCVANPAVAAQWLANAEQAFRDDPARLMMSASPNDGAGFCVCANCRALDHPDGPRVFGHVALTDRYVKFWNTLARGLRERFPEREVWVGAYAYSAYRTPPIAEKLEPNIAVGYVGHFPMVSEQARRAEKEQWLAWARQAKAMVYRPNLFHYSGGFLGLPTLSLRRTMEDFRFLAENQCIGIEVDTLPMCWATQGAQYYLMAHLAYDPLQDGETVLRDYCERGFGPAAPEVARYFAALETAHEAVLERVKMSSGWAREATEVFQEIYDDQRWAVAAEPLQAAEAAVAAGPELYRQRVEFLRTGFDAARLQIEVLRAMKQVRASGGKEAAAIRRADELCAARDALFKRYGGLAIKRARWYVESRRLADYVDAPSAPMRQGTYTAPSKAPDMKAKD
jgi:hypothetical protein